MAELEDPRAPETEPDKPEGVEPHLFNEEARSAVEDAYEAFQKESAQAEEPPAIEEAPPVPADKPADKGLTVESSEPVTEEPRASFKTLEDAEKSYLESRKKMQEATERAKRLEREKELLLQAQVEMTEYIRRQTAAQQPAPPPPPQAPGPGITKEELEAKFYEDPVGFVFSLTEAGRQAAIREAYEKTQAEQKAARHQAAVRSFTETTQKYFDENYTALKPVEDLVTGEIVRVWSDNSFIQPLKEDRGKDVLTKAKIVVDEATRRLRERLPVLTQALEQGDNQPTTERLRTGAPPIVPGGGKNATIRPSAPATGETNEQYVAGRRARLERMQLTGAIR